MLAGSLLASVTFWPMSYVPPGGVAVTTGATVSAVMLTSNSASPTLVVDPLTEVMLNRTELAVLAGKFTVSPDPLLGSAGTGTVLPSENCKLPPVTWSDMTGRSKRVTALMVLAAEKLYWIQLPSLP